MCLLLSFVYSQPSDATVVAPTDGGNISSTTVVPAPTGISGKALDEEKVFLDGTVPTQPGATVANTANLGFWDFVRMILVLALVVAAIYGIYFLIRRGKKQDVGQTELIKVLATQTLPGNRAVHLLEVGKHVFLVGNAEQSIRLIAEIQDQESIDELRLKSAAEQDAAPKSFADMLGGVFTPPANKSETPFQSPLDFLKAKKDKIKNLGGKE